LNISPTLPIINYLASLFGNPLPIRDSIYYFSYARGGLLTAINTFKLTRGTENSVVFLPEYICDTVTVMLKKCSVKYKYYRVTKDLYPDLDSLKQITSNDILLIVNYFGLTAHTEQLKKFLALKNPYLIEDYAHSMLPYEDFSSKIIGDAAIFGLRKALPLPDGGALYLKAHPIIPIFFNNERRGLYRSPWKMIIQNYFPNFRAINKLTTLPEKRQSMHPPSYYEFSYSRPISLRSSKIANTFNYKHLLNLRKKFFNQYLEGLSSIGDIEIPLLMKSEVQFVPWVFFFYTSRAEELINYLRKKGIASTFFPDLPQEIIDSKNFSQTKFLANQSVTLPLHQNLTIDQIILIINAIKNFFNPKDRNE